MDISTIIYLIGSSRSSDFVNPLIFRIVIHNKLFNKPIDELSSVSFGYIWSLKILHVLFCENAQHVTNNYVANYSNKILSLLLLQKNWTPQELCLNLLWSENSSTFTCTLTSPRTPLIVSKMGSHPLISDPPLNENFRISYIETIGYI